MPHDHILLAPLQAPTVYSAVVDRLRRSIALGVVLPGDRLPSERILAESLGVSRVTIREALRILQGEGLLVTRRGNAGTVVAEDAHSLRRMNRTYEAEIDEVFEYRVAVESMAAQLAARRHEPHDIETLLKCQRALADSTNVHTFRRADSEFHLTVARLSANGMLERSIQDARAAAFAWLDRREFTVVQSSSLKGHDAIIQAISNCDADAAAAAMTQHIEDARGEVLAALPTLDYEF
jgi:GntR family transcriptional regulator, transcriptional repressor for pyruvate dehydrogenase complex